MLMTAPVQVGGCVVGLICIRPDDQGRMMDQGKPHPSVVVDPVVAPSLNVSAPATDDL
jgi:hypothetical protein